MDDGDLDVLITLITLSEIEFVLKWFKKDKIPGPDGWPIEFYLSFFEIARKVLLMVFKDCRVLDRIYDSLNSTFTTLIPKVENPTSFHDY